MKTIKYFLVTVFIVSLGACVYEFPEPVAPGPISGGNADFDKFVSLGDLATAGFSDLALYQESQETCFPAMMAKSFNQITSRAFVTPLFESENGFNPLQSVIPVFVAGKLKLILPQCVQSGITPFPLPGQLISAWTGDKTKLNNFGVPFMKVIESLAPGYGTLNSFYGRFASNPVSSMAAADAAAASGTFFSLWIGNYDILGYASQGATGNSSGTGAYDMTDPGQFSAAFNAVLDMMLSATASSKGVVANIPDITDLPFFTVVNGSLTSAKKIPFALDSATAAQLNGLYQLSGWGNPSFGAGTVNKFTITAGSGTIRQMDPSKDFLLFTLPQDSLGTGPINPCNPTGAQRAGWGVTKPIPSLYVLDEDEMNTIVIRTGNFNTAIKNAVEARNLSGTRLAFSDMNSFYKTMRITGIRYGNATIRSEYPLGGFLSLDGITPTPKGASVIANKMIDDINKAFNANLPKANPGEYRGNVIP